jgi:hypothetical protein
MLYYNKYYLTASLRVLPALKTGEFIAGILIDSPVLGLTPFLAALLDILNAPKPVIFTSLPHFNSEVTIPIIEDNVLETAS